MGWAEASLRLSRKASAVPVLHPNSGPKQARKMLFRNQHSWQLKTSCSQGLALSLTLHVARWSQMMFTWGFQGQQAHYNSS